MSGPVNICAGSSGGAQPPREDPPRLPSHCQSAPPAASRKGRSKAKCLDVKKYVQKHGKIRLQFEKRDCTYKAIGTGASWYSSAVGLHTRDCCEPFHANWDEVPEHQKAQVPIRLRDWFDIDYGYSNGLYLDVVDRDAQKCYREWKNELNKHFKNVGGPEDVARARAHPPPSLQNGYWNRCCKWFSSGEFLKMSQKNTGNCKKQAYTSLQGRKSYSEHRYDKNRMVQERARQMAAASGSSSARARVDERAIIEVSRLEWDPLCLKQQRKVLDFFGIIFLRWQIF